MSAKTKIEWTDFTINFWWGCTKVSPACAFCYALSIARRLSKSLFGFTVEWGDGKARAERLEKARLEALALNKSAERKGVRYRVFVNSMSDWLDDQVPADWLASLLETIHLCPKLDFQLLTKRPENWSRRLHDATQRILAHNPGSKEAWKWARDWAIGVFSPSNVWIGTTVENQEWADKRIPALLEIPALVRFLSCEPLLGSVKLEPIREHYMVASENGGPSGSFSYRNHFPLSRGRIHWVICGGESGPGARPMHPDWARSLRDQCATAGAPFFFKQWGEWAPKTAAFGDRGIYPTGPTMNFEGDKLLAVKCGKFRSGRLLDGVEHNAFPKTL